MTKGDILHASELAIVPERFAGICILHVHGRVTFQTEALFSHGLSEQIGPKVRLLLDLTEAEHINSVGLGIIIRSLKRLRDQGGDLAVVSNRDALTRAFQVLNFHTVLTLVTTVDEGLRVLGCGDAARGAAQPVSSDGQADGPEDPREDADTNPGV